MQKVGLSQAFSKTVYAQIKSLISYAERVLALSLA